MTESSARAEVDALLTRNGLKLSVEDYEWFVGLYDEVRSDLGVLNASELRDEEPAVVYQA